VAEPDERAEALAKEAEAEAARSATRRALWRLDLLEYGLLAFALILALVGGALVAWVLRTVVSLPFRLTWAAVSLLLFIVPGMGVYLRELRRGKKKPAPDQKTEPKDPKWLKTKG